MVNIMGGMENTGGIKLNDHKRKLKNRWAFNPFGHCCKKQANCKCLYTVKKASGFPVTSRDVTYQLSLAGNNFGNGKTVNLLLQCKHWKFDWRNIPLPTVILSCSENIMLEADLIYFLFCCTFVSLYARSLHNILNDDLPKVLWTYFPSLCLRKFVAYCKLTDVSASCSAHI